MKTNYSVLALMLLSSFWACNPSQKTAKTTKDDGIIELVFLQLNDVYEISPVGTEDKGGLSRVAQLRKDLLAKNPNTYTLLSGDFISPSVIGTLKYEGKRIKGRHMVEVLNTLGLDWVAFGNHEFDYDYDDLQARLDESNFTWIGTNLRNVKGDAKAPFYKMQGGVKKECPDYVKVMAKDADGTTVNFGVLTTTLPSNPKPYVYYDDMFEAPKRNFEAIRPTTDFSVAITHLAIEDDKKLAEVIPALPLIMGGHEHDNQMHRVGSTVIAKADANAKTVYVHRLTYNKKTKTSTVKSELIAVSKTTGEDPQTAAVVAKWEKVKTDALSSAGFDATKNVIKFSDPLDCRDMTTRTSQATVGYLITSAMIEASKNGPNCAILNSGSIRVDDILQGYITELDVVRMLPFGGTILEVEMRGSLLKKTLDTGLKNAGNGGYLQWNRIRQENGYWLINQDVLKEDKIYKVALPDFLLTGNEQNMAFIKAESNANGTGTTNPDIVSIKRPDPKDKADLRNDIRLALIKYLRK